MKRIGGFAALALLMCVVAGSVGQEKTAADRVERRDKKGVTSTITGRIVEDTPAGIKIRSDTKAKDIDVPSSEVQRIIYGDYNNNLAKAVGNAATSEQGGNYPALVKQYEDIVASADYKLPSVGPAGKRYVEFRLAQARAGAAETDEQVKGAIKGWPTRRRQPE